MYHNSCCCSDVCDSAIVFNNKKYESLFQNKRVKHITEDCKQKKTYTNVNDLVMLPLKIESRVSSWTLVVLPYLRGNI